MTEENHGTGDGPLCFFDGGIDILGVCRYREEKKSQKKITGVVIFFGQCAGINPP